MRVEIRLPEYPSTGYVWESDIEPDSHTYEGEPSKDGETVYGGPATPIFVFDDLPSGTFITFSNRRRWEKNKMPRQIVCVSVLDNTGLIDRETGRYNCCGTDAQSADPFHAVGCPNRQG
jgi:hypothetical protein